MYDQIITSPYLKNRQVAPSINSSKELSTPFSPSLPSLPNTPYMYNYLKNGRSNIRNISSRDDLSLSTRREYASSIYSDDSCHLPDDEDNIVEDEDDVAPPSSSEATYNVTEPKQEEEKKIKNPRYNGHFDDDDEDESNKTLPVPMQRPLSTMKKVWDNPFGRISFIEYTIEKQKEKEKKESKNNAKKYVVTKPPLKNKNSKNSSQMIVSKRSVSSLTASLNKSRQEKIQNTPDLKSRTNSSGSLHMTDTLSNKNFKSNSLLNNKDSFLSVKEGVLHKRNDSNQLLKRASESNLERNNSNSKRDSVVYDDKRGSIISVTNLIRYSDFYNDSNDDSISSTNAGSHYSQALSQYNMYKSKKDDDNKDSSTVKTEIIDENDNYDSNILNFSVPDENGEHYGKEIKLSVKKSNKGLNVKSDNRKAIITQVASEVEETTTNNDSTESEKEGKEDAIEYNPYYPCIP
eukprot:jgi/Orpsp1_1/1192940/evm.model.d7180000097028.1